MCTGTDQRLTSAGHQLTSADIPLTSAGHQLRSGSVDSATDLDASSRNLSVRAVVGSYRNFKESAPMHNHHMHLRHVICLVLILLLNRFYFDTQYLDTI